jgi:predicted MFS family arabinose efflux permease
MHFGWRVSFYLFGAVGVIWSAGWWRWYRNRPADKAGIPGAELAEIGTDLDEPAHQFPWKAIAVNGNIWAIMGSACAYLYSYYFFLFWLPTYMIRSRGFSESETQLSALPFVLGATANLAGGFARDVAVRRWGLMWGPRLVCQLGLSIAAAAAVAAVWSSNRYLALAWLAICYAGIAFQQPTVFATCVDIGRRYAGAVAGCMNSAAALGGFMSSVIFGYLVQRSGNYDAVLLSMAGALLAGAALWFLIDAAHPVSDDARSRGNVRCPLVGREGRPKHLGIGDD